MKLEGPECPFCLTGSKESEPLGFIVADTDGALKGTRALEREGSFVPSAVWDEAADDSLATLGGLGGKGPGCAEGRGWVTAVPLTGTGILVPTLRPIGP